MFNSFTGLLIVLIGTSSFALLGSLIAYLILPRIGASKKLWEFFAAYLMILLSLNLLLISVINNEIRKLSALNLFGGSFLGIAITFLLMRIYGWLRGRGHEAHIHSAGNGVSLSAVIFIILAIHELAEGASVAELFSEASVISLSASLIPIFIFAIHEFPEGLLLVTPFFLEKRIKSGLYAALVNQVLFIASGVIFFRFIQFEPSIATDAFIHTLPIGGIFYLGLHELSHAIGRWTDLKLFYSHLGLRIVSLISLIAVVCSLIFVFYGVQREKERIFSRYETDPATGKTIPVIDLGAVDFVAQKREVLCYVPGGKSSGKEPENPAIEYSVIAEANGFIPARFSFYHAAPSVLKILAKDKDYVFQMKSEGINVALPRGITTEVQLSSLGMGTYYFNCGDGCGGIVFVDRDLDDYCEE